ncbi:MAG: hypothetical protein Q9M37_01410 [Desulfonauticus sp.]|nr:hypothetical protein [Desulfonauticus sp.]
MQLIEIYKIWSEKPEIIVDFPDWMLSKKSIKELQGQKDVVIAEIAGRDSFAAVFKYLENHSVNVLVPTIAYTATEYGSVDITLKKCMGLKERLKSNGIRCLDPIFLGSPTFWWKLCGRYISYLIDEFGFYTPCIGCHLYLHTIRIPLAKLINSDIIISGEREKHDGKMKLNQTDVALNYYTKICSRYNINLVHPIRYIDNGQEITSILQEEWAEGKEQLKCVLSKNYISKEGKVYYPKEIVLKTKSFFEEFAIPIVDASINKWCRNDGNQ